MHCCSIRDAWGTLDKKSEKTQRPSEPCSAPATKTVAVRCSRKRGSPSWCNTLARYARKVLGRRNIILEVTLFVAFVMLLSVMISINRKLSALGPRF